MPYLAASLVALVAGPALGLSLERAPRAKAVIEWVVMAGLLALILLHVLPEAVALAQLWVVPIAAASVGATLLLERWSSISKAPSTLVLVLGVLALSFHSALDGTAVAGADGPGGARLLALAVVVHRIPTSMALWWLVSRNLGRAWAVGVLGADAAATLVGYFAGEAVLGSASPFAIGVLQAIIAGSLLHVAFHVRTHGHGSHAAASPTR